MTILMQSGPTGSTSWGASVAGGVSVAKAISGATSAGGDGPSSSRGLEIDVGILRLVTVLEDVATLMVCPVTSWIRMVTGRC